MVINYYLMITDCYIRLIHLIRAIMVCIFCSNQKSTEAGVRSAGVQRPAGLLAGRLDHSRLLCHVMQIKIP